MRGEATAAILFLHMRSLRVGAFVPVCGCFHQLSTSFHASPSTHSVVLSRQFSVCLIRCSAPRSMRPTDLLCLACGFRVAMNEQSDMTTDRKFQYLQKKCVLLIFILCLCRATIVCPRSGSRKVTNLFLLACDLEYVDCFHRNRT